MYAKIAIMQKLAAMLGIIFQLILVGMPRLFSQQCARDVCDRPFVIITKGVKYCPQEPCHICTCNSSNVWVCRSMCLLWECHLTKAVATQTKWPHDRSFGYGACYCCQPFQQIMAFLDNCDHNHQLLTCNQIFSRVLFKTRSYTIGFGCNCWSLFWLLKVECSTKSKQGIAIETSEPPPQLRSLPLSLYIYIYIHTD